MTSFIRTDSFHPDFQMLVQLLDRDLAERDGAEHLFYDQFNKTTEIKNVVVGYKNEQPTACGAFKLFIAGTAEIKRMFVLPDFRGQGFGGLVLKELETWAAEIGFDNCVLETGKKQPEAISLYQRSGYRITDNYGPYIGIENSVCMAKSLV